MEPIPTFLIALYGTIISFLEERFGSFQSLPPNLKQLINSILTIIIPYIVLFFSPYWKLEFGNPDLFWQSILTLLSPFIIWLVSQLAHYGDKALRKNT